MPHFGRATLTAVALTTAATLITACSSSSGGSSSSNNTDVEKSTLTFSYSNATMQVEKVPLHMALGRLDKDGIKTKESFNKEGNDVVQAVARGDADFGTANASTVLSSIKKGVPIKAVLTTYKPFYVLVAASGVKKPADLDGSKRVGIQAKVSSTTLYTDLALNTAPSAKPKILTVPGSANRVQAMMAGQLDASVLQPADWLKLKKKKPGKFHVIYDVAKENPKIIDSLTFTSTKTLKSDPHYVRKVLGTVQKQYDKVYDEPDTLAKHMANDVPKTSDTVAKQLAKSSSEDKIWPADGGLKDTNITATLDAMTKSGMFDNGKLPTTSKCCTTKYLNDDVGD